MSGGGGSRALFFVPLCFFPCFSAMRWKREMLPARRGSADGVVVAWRRAVRASCAAVMSPREGPALPVKPPMVVVLAGPPVDGHGGRMGAPRGRELFRSFIIGSRRIATSKPLAERSRTAETGYGHATQWRAAVIGT